MNRMQKSLGVLALTVAMFGALSLSATAAKPTPDPAHVVADAAGGYTVSPTGDTRGVKDADNIEWALRNLTPGATVALTAGHFYASRGIVVEGFSGTLRGAGRDLTILEATRRSRGRGFESTFQTAYISLSVVWPTLLWFEFPASVTVSDLTMQVLDPNPTDGQLMWGTQSTALAHFIADFGGDSDTTLKNVSMKGSSGGFNGANVAVGIHSMRGSFPWPDPAIAGRGDVTIEDSQFENIGDAAITVMWYEHSSITVRNVISTHSGQALWFEGFTNSQARVERSTFAGGSWREIGLKNTSHVTISQNTFKDFDGSRIWWAAPIYVRNDNHHIVIERNEFINIDGGVQAVLVRGGLNNADNTIRNNDYENSGLPGWPDGRGAVLLAGDNNLVIERKFPDGTTLDEQVLDLGENNIVVGSR